MFGNHNLESVRREQIAEGSRMAREEGAMPVIHRQQPRAGNKYPAKAKGAPKGHEAFLKQLETSGAQVLFEKMNGEEIMGTIKCSDKYTVTVRDTQEDGSVYERVLFKHDLSEFRSMTPRKVQEAGNDPE